MLYSTVQAYLFLNVLDMSSHALNEEIVVGSNFLNNIIGKLSLFLSLESFGWMTKKKVFGYRIHYYQLL